jgi:hypothetical protein
LTAKFSEDGATVAAASLLAYSSLQGSIATLAAARDKRRLPLPMLVDSPTGGRAVAGVA